MSPPGKILLIEDDVSAASALSRVLADEGFVVATATRGDDGLREAERGPFDVVITDLKLPGVDGLELVRSLHATRPRLPIILMTAHGTTDTAIEATKQGAYDYLLKPFEMEEMIELVGNACTSSRFMSEPVELGPAVTARAAIIGDSRLMQELYKEIGRVAAKQVTVLIRGETGTGKELVARALYQYSDRANAPFVAVNCAAIPETLLESELFGHERGAFTGAETRRIGRFEQAHGGTLFLDEIGDLSLATQAKLLRVLQEKCIQRLGGRETIPVNVRVIAATHRDLETAIKDRLFREDLFYRLSVVVITPPPLRQRSEDVPLLVKYFIQWYSAELELPTSSIQKGALELLQSRPWPGNVRELENVVRQALLLARGYVISADHIQQVLARTAQSIPQRQKALVDYASELLARVQEGAEDHLYARAVEDLERELFSRAIKLARGNQAKAARWLGVSRLTMREKLNRFGVHPAQGGTSFDE
ncbi:MAG: sigma-54-dependent Fis family transcriptional regulator [Verrucomicrobia bacterium]|nr:MAG: sigma-54-dependent Fis family transcriptional regulator [Verrucomicrobiota bacterium]